MESLSIDAANALSAASLAFVGDAVFTLFVRDKLTRLYDYKSGRLSKMAAGYVNARSQSKMLEALSPKLTCDESVLVKRVRNYKTGSKAKNAALSDYKRATALEGLIGFLFLTGQNARLNEIQEFCFSFTTENRTKENQ